MHNRYWGIGLVFGLFLGLVSVAGCSAGDNSSTSDPYAAVFAEAASMAQSEYVRGVLADGQITEEEIQDARAQVSRCAYAAGVSVSYEKSDYGNYDLTYSGDLSNAQATALNECQEQWMGAIDWLYWSVYTDPENQGQFNAVAACLVRNDLVPEGFTGQDWEDYLLRNGDQSETPPVWTTPMVMEPLPGGTPYEAQGVTACMSNPAHDLR